MDEKDIKKIEEIFRHHIGILSEDFQHKLDIVVEGHQMLSEKLDRVEAHLDKRIDGVEKRIDGVAADIAAHRADTESHRAGYRISEDKD